MGYFSYARAGFAPDTHFEAFRSLERLRAGARELIAVRRELPGLAVAGDVAVLDGASQRPERPLLLKVASGIVSR